MARQRRPRRGAPARRPRLKAGAGQRPAEGSAGRAGGGRHGRTPPVPRKGGGRRLAAPTPARGDQTTHGDRRAAEASRAPRTRRRPTRPTHGAGGDREGGHGETEAGDLRGDGGRAGGRAAAGDSEPPAGGRRKNAEGRAKREPGAGTPGDPRRARLHFCPEAAAAARGSRPRAAPEGRTMRAASKLEISCAPDRADRGLPRHGARYATPEGRSR